MSEVNEATMAAPKRLDFRRPGNVVPITGAIEQPHTLKAPSLAMETQIAPVQENPDTEDITVTRAQKSHVNGNGFSVEGRQDSEMPEQKTPTAIEELSVEELQRQREEIDRALAEKQQAEKANLIQQIVEVATTYKVTIEELVDALGGFKPKRKGVKARAKYRDPTTGVTWSGRGKEPTWMRGHDREEFLIPDGDQDES